MPARYLVVIGASAGGLSALKQLVGQFPRDLPAAVIVVLHVAPTFESTLPQILSLAGPVPAAHALGGETLEEGVILVAPPDHHILVRGTRVELSRGPKENHARPAIDPTLRTAARTYGVCVTGVVLSGTLGDGTMGLMAVKARGGGTIVQNPQEAAYAGMPEHALRFVEVDHVLAARDIAAQILRYAADCAAGGEVDAMSDGNDRVRERIERDFAGQVQGGRAEQQSIYTCPDCGGILWQQSDEAALSGFRCYQGHIYAPERLLAEKSEALETALWSATRSLVERATLNRQLARQLHERGLEQRAANLEEQAAMDEAHIALLRREILQADPASEEHRQTQESRALP